MFLVLLLIIILLGAIMTGAILMQNSKGAGLSGAFGGMGTGVGQMLGVRHASDVLAKATWWMGGIFTVLIFVINMFFLPSEGTEESIIRRGARERGLTPMPQQQQTPPAQQGQQAPQGGQQPAQPQPQQQPAQQPQP